MGWDGCDAMRKEDGEGTKTNDINAWMFEVDEEELKREA